MQSKQSSGQPSHPQYQRYILIITKKLLTMKTFILFFHDLHEGLRIRRSYLQSKRKWRYWWHIGHISLTTQISTWNPSSTPMFCALLPSTTTAMEKLRSNTTWSRVLTWQDQQLVTGGRRAMFTPVLPESTTGSMQLAMWGPTFQRAILCGTIFTQRLVWVSVLITPPLCLSSKRSLKLTGIHRMPCPSKHWKEAIPVQADSASWFSFYCNKNLHDKLADLNN